MNIIGKTELLGKPDGDILGLDKDFFPQPWTDSQWQDLNLSQHLLFSFTSDSKLIGFALFSRLSGDDMAHLYKILLHPEARKHGLATSFWADIVKNLQEKGVARIYLEVEATNEKAIKFYQKVGFSLLRRVKSYYSNGTDGLMMELTL